MRFGLPTAVGLVMANMIGSGAFITSGFMARDLDGSAILLAWLIGGLLAACGALCYAVVSRWIPRSGGEYRFLSEAYHPILGCLAGWTSIVVGFAAPLAMAAMAAGAYAQALCGKPVAQFVGVGLLLAMGAIHGLGLKLGKSVQNGAVILKVSTILIFIASAFLIGKLDWHAVLPTSETLGLTLTRPFAVSLIYIGFAYSGWNAAAYVAGEVENPSRNVPRALLLGCGAVALLYMLLNLVFVSALPSKELISITSSPDRILTLGHVVGTHVLGETAGWIASAMILLILVSTVSAKTLAGPRVCDAMAKDGLLPRWLELRPVLAGGLAPVGLQTALAVGLMLTNTFEALLAAVGVTLTIFTSLTAAAALKYATEAQRSWVVPVLLLFLAGNVWTALQAIIAAPRVLLWLLVALVVGLVLYFLAPRAIAGQAEGA